DRVGHTSPQSGIRCCRLAERRERQRYASVFPDNGTVRGGAERSDDRLLESGGYGNGFPSSNRRRARADRARSDSSGSEPFKNPFLFAALPRLYPILDRW